MDPLLWNGPLINRWVLALKKNTSAIDVEQVFAVEQALDVEQVFAVEWALAVEQAQRSTAWVLAFKKTLQPLMWNKSLMWNTSLLWNRPSAVEQALCCGTGP